MPMQTHGVSGGTRCEIAKYRCAIICLHAPLDVVASLDACLAVLPGLACVTPESVGATVTELDAAVFAASPTALRDLVERISQLRRERLDCAILVAGSGFDAAQIATLFSAGAHDFVGAPVSGSELWARLQRALGLLATDAAPQVLNAMSPQMRDFIGHSPAFIKQIAKLPTIAGCDAGVLILGETGTGKEVCAQASHYQSARASRPWVAVNCAAIPVELMESELFGHARGAYTNAHAARPGLVCEAEGGTLFLDEIDCISYGAQAKLLRFLEEKEFRRIGSNVVHHADVRIIAASNENLETLVLKGAFRRDLYFRLNVLALTLPPLRERLDDISDLALHFVMRFARQFGRRIEGLTPMALRRLYGYAWPGNVRELAHTIERAVLMCEGRVLGVEDFDLGASDVVADNSFRAAKSRVVDEFERSYIERLLAAHDGNVTHAAQAAKKNRRAFFEL